MNYTESLAYLDSLGKFGIKLGMERIEALLKELDNPQDKIKTVHVTGTNGKGSVSSMIANILLASNLKVGKRQQHDCQYFAGKQLKGGQVCFAAPCKIQRAHQH